MAAKRKTNAQLVEEAEADLARAQEQVARKRKVLADRKRRAASTERKRENHAKLRIGAEVLRWAGDDWSEFDFEGFTVWLSRNFKPGAFRTEKLQSDDAWGRLRAWEGGEHMADYAPAGGAVEHEPSGIEREVHVCPECGAPLIYRAGYCTQCGAGVEWSVGGGAQIGVRATGEHADAARPAGAQGR